MSNTSESDVITAYPEEAGGTDLHGMARFSLTGGETPGSVASTHLFVSPRAVAVRARANLEAREEEDLRLLGLVAKDDDDGK